MLHYSFLPENIKNLSADGQGEFAFLLILLGAYCAKDNPTPGTELFIL